MSIYCAVEKDQKIVFGCDSIHTFGRMVSPKGFIQTPKIVFGTDFACGIAGTPSVRLHLNVFLSKGEGLSELKGEDEVFDFFHKFFEFLKDERYLNPDVSDDTDFEAWEFEFLLTNKHGIFSIHELREVFRHRNFFAIGSGSEFALGAMHAVYDTTPFDAKAVVNAGLTAADAFDSMSSSPFNILSF